jgi:hypothetical protein
MAKASTLLEEYRLPLDSTLNFTSPVLFVRLLCSSSKGMNP